MPKKDRFSKNDVVYQKVLNVNEVTVNEIVEYYKILNFSSEENYLK